MTNFENIDQLKQWLAVKGIDTASWGTGGAKTIENLWAEIVEGETEIQDEPPLRQVKLVNVVIRQDNRVLVETAQEFGEKQQRRRESPPAEKIKPGERPRETALRCLQEELQIDPTRVEILAVPSEPHQKIVDSPSYPGLPTCYLRYEVEAKVTGLPQESFQTIETAHDDGDPVWSHQWEWILKQKE